MPGGRLGSVQCEGAGEEKNKSEKIAYLQRKHVMWDRKYVTWERARGKQEWAGVSSCCSVSTGAGDPADPAAPPALSHAAPAPLGAPTAQGRCRRRCIKARFRARPSPFDGQHGLTWK